VQGEVAQGLAYIQDKNSISLIIDACRKAPADAAITIALPLIYFDDEAARRAVDRYVPKQLADTACKEQSEGQTALGSSPLR